MNNTPTPKTFTNYKGHTFTEVYRLECPEYGAVSTWRIFSRKNAAGKIMDYSLSFFRPGAITPPDQTISSRKRAVARLAEIQKAHPGYTLTMF
jgi:hypothetical protein